MKSGRAWGRGYLLGRTVVKQYLMSIVCSSVHLQVSERLTLVAGRDGGLQNMEILGMILLRVTDSDYGHIHIAIDNHEQRAIQFQVISTCSSGCGLASERD